MPSRFSQVQGLSVDAHSLRLMLDDKLVAPGFIDIQVHYGRYEDSDATPSIHFGR